jgi:hypothetical protein
LQCRIDGHFLDEEVSAHGLGLQKWHRGPLMKSSGPFRTLADRLTRGDLQGYLALTLTALLFLIPFLHIPFRAIETAIGLVVLGLIVVFGLRGVRRNRPGATVAAGLSLAVLAIASFWAFAMAYIEFALSQKGRHN